MKTSLPTEQLTNYVGRQLNHFFPDESPILSSTLKYGVVDALRRLDHCFGYISLQHYCRNDQALFNHLYSDQYLMFLWFLSNSLWRQNADASLLDKVYLLNKALHAFDCMYDTPLPDIFIIIHGVGTVLGKGHYSDYFVAYQGCTVGQAHDKYPILGIGVGLGAGASVIGNCSVGDRASIGAGCSIINTDVPECSSVYRNEEGKLIVKQASEAVIASRYFTHVA